ncbi:hypothetical protein CYMTET_6834 [Cymbomonas tetramitiformis]|uniref:DUF676 domain-containing protein n=1 Tax=Cymbomonas tetramitiformis TaxID=36881 RepID=A0AAE0GY49_9CHLO|nr:hypothetical protein CYMTET_6834 [Cymbomonas tetramitiformis]
MGVSSCFSLRADRHPMSSWSCGTRSKVHPTRRQANLAQLSARSNKVAREATFSQHSLGNNVCQQRSITLGERRRNKFSAEAVGISTASEHSSSPKPTHLILLVNGIFGTANDWDFARAAISDEARADPSNTESAFVHASRANEFFATFGGIDEAGKRLASEVKTLRREQPELTCISIVGHSLGGLISRAAIAHMLDAKAGTLCGLRPRHFVTLSTPHLGVFTGLPITTWLGLKDSLYSAIAPPIGSTVFNRTGEELLIDDQKTTSQPLLVEMTSDQPDVPYLSALAAFKQRTAYACVEYDHLVDWRSATMSQKSDAVPPFSGPRIGRFILNEVPPPIAPSGAMPTRSEYAPPLGAQSTNDEIADSMAQALQSVGWHRVDVCFDSASVPYFSHYYMQVTRAWLHQDGAEVVKHVAELLLSPPQND